ncbi:AraC family transcriptional regulator [Anaerostipes hominis (ex Lee et al. 2021)]
MSSYFCYSSQAHFQSAFKKQYGITPMQYRKQSRIL